MNVEERTVEKAMKKKILCLLLTAVLLLAGVPAQAAESQETAVAGYTFNPHLYLPLLSQDVPREYWDSFHNLCDALRRGEDTFECASEEAYKWATSPVTLTELFPPACMMITGEGRNGSVPFKNGVGKIYYQIPAEEYVERQTRFEAYIADVLNATLEPDDNDFEKCLKLYDYMSTHYTYNDNFIENYKDGANYTAFMTGKGQCIELSSVYAYLLLQAGVEALQVGCNNPDMAHAWTYIVLDGKGYHSDPTWALRPADDGGNLYLYYFLMTGDRRDYTGCAVDDLTAPLLPRYWANFSSVHFTADETEYTFPDDSWLISLDEADRVVRYSYYGEQFEYPY